MKYSVLFPTHTPMLYAKIPVLDFDDSNDKTALIDGRDHVKVANYHWFLSNGYACTKISNRTVSMHQMIMGKSPNGDFTIDHKDRNRLNNTRANLHFATRRQQARNRGSKRRKHTYLSNFVGISRTKKGKFTARFRRKYLGTFPSAEDAAHAYNCAARAYDAKHGIVFGNLNRDLS